MSHEDLVSQAEAEAGVSTTVRKWTAERIQQLVASVGGSGFAKAYKSADETRISNTTLTNDVHLLLPLTLGFWRINAALFADEGAANPNLKFRLAATAGLVGNIEYGWSAPSGIESGVISDFTTDTGVISLGTVKEELQVNGVVEVTTAGTLQLQWAQAITDADPTTFYKLSALTARKIS